LHDKGNGEFWAGGVRYIASLPTCISKPIQCPTITLAASVL